MAVRYAFIPGSSNYKVGEDGSVWSRMKRGNTRKTHSAWKRLKAILSHGYLTVSVRLDGETAARRVRVHRMVLLAFTGPCPPGQEARHLNGVRADARLSNLCYGTKVENEQDKILHGTANVETNNPMAKLDHDKVRQMIDFFEAGHTYQQTAVEFNVAMGTVQSVIDGKTWKTVTGGVNRNRKTKRGNRLSEDTVRAIKEGLKNGKTYSALAEQFSTSLCSIHRIKHGKCWSHL